MKTKPTVCDIRTTGNDSYYKRCARHWYKILSVRLALGSAASVMFRHQTLGNRSDVFFPT